MAGDWIKWVKGLSRRREVAVIARKLEMTRREAACACMEMWEWADEETIDGHIPGATRDDFDSILGIPGFGVVLESPEVEWIRFNERGISFPRWDRNNGETAKKRALESRKKQRQRDLEKKKVSRKKRDKRPADVPDVAALEREKEGESEKEKNLTLFVSEEAPLPPVLDTPEFRTRLAEWLAYKTERRQAYKPQGMASMISRAATLSKEYGLKAVLDAMQRAMSNGWDGWDQPSCFEKGKSNGNRRNEPGPGQRHTPGVGLGPV